MKSIQNTKKYYVYAHIRNDNGEIFYIGKGTDNKSHKDYYRSKSLHRRTQFWKNVVEKAGGYRVEIIAICKTENHAFLLEKLLIKNYGRRNNNTGTLVNLTDGGEGACGVVMSVETRKKHSINASKQRSEAWIKSIRIARKNGGNGGVVRKGDKLPDWWRERISKSVMGENNSMFGVTGEQHHNSRKVVDTQTNEIYVSVSEASQKYGYKMKTLFNWLTGFRPNPTTLQFYGRS